MEELKSITEISTLIPFSSRVKEVLVGNILPFWLKYAVDTENGGFWGKVTNDLRADKKAPKGLILNTRILWTFSALYKFEQEDVYLEMARRAYEYIMDKFIDPFYGGAYWMVDCKGTVLDDEKKIYGQAFTIFALAEYYSAFGKKAALEMARNIYYLIEKQNRDEQNKGYFEVSNRDWTIPDDMQLSEADMNAKKSMNTHLHLMEAYSALYRSWPDKELKTKIGELIFIFYENIFESQTSHCRLFFNEYWHPQSRAISFGHDIELSWLLTEAAELTNDTDWIEKSRALSLDLVNATMRDGFSEHYGIYSEKLDSGELCMHLDWWQQAEAIVGLLNAYQISGDENYLMWVKKAWSFIERFVIDHTHGEWFYEVSRDGIPNLDRNKMSEWKGPYHNTRTCLEVLKRLGCIKLQDV